jgi:hypothetical protein
LHTVKEEHRPREKGVRAVAFAGPPAAEAAANSLASTQAFQAIGSLGETGSIALGAGGVSLGALLAAQGLAANAVFGLGTTWPTVGLTPFNVAFNSEYASMVSGLVSQLAGSFAAQSYMGLGTSAALANAGRRFLINTYFGL